MSDPDQAFDDSFEGAVTLGNRLADADHDAWDVADGLLAGAIQFWLYSRQPCGDPRCDDCAPIASAGGRLEELLRIARQYAEDSEYFHQANDITTGRA